MDQSVRQKLFVEKIWQWYAHHKRQLPWRDLDTGDDTQRAYMILVSEVMLQQTQVARVKIIFKKFLKQFPTISVLASASNRDVLIAWRGMGYNSRALRLRDAARTIVARCSLTGCSNEKRATSQQATKVGFPRSMKELLKIPGIGPYTAAAIRNFAFGIPTLCIDVNIERILTRVFRVRAKKRMEKKAGEVLKIAMETPASSVSTAQWHSALMDFGSLACTKRSPKCAQCPLSKGICRSAFRGDRATRKQAKRKQEPGRLVGGRFIPNRIFRGKVVEVLRDARTGRTLESVGREICIDWSTQYRPWLEKIMQRLCGEGLLRKNRKEKYELAK